MSNITVAKNELEPCKIKLDIEVSAETIKETHKSKSREFLSNTSLPGFRKGKSPTKLVKRRYEKQIIGETLNTLVSDSIKEALNQEDLEPATRPEIVNKETIALPDEGENLIFSITFDVAPEIEIPDYKNITLDVPQADINEEVVDSFINNFLQSRSKFEPVDRPAEKGDLLKVTFQGELDDEELPETVNYLIRQEEQWLNLRTPETLPGCIEALVGVSAGDTRTFTVEFPEDHYEKALAGKKGEYKVTVHEVQGSVTPELDEATSNEFFGTKNVDEAKERVKGYLENQNNSQKHMHLSNSVVEKLLQGTNFPLPPTILAHENYTTMMQLCEQELREGKTEEQLQEMQEELSERAASQAAATLKRRYILEKIALAEEIEVSQQEIAGYIAQIAQMNKVSPKKMTKDLEKNNRFFEVFVQLREIKTINKIIELADVKEVEVQNQEG